MWSGFITGFAEKSVSLIEERDKEIRKSVNSRIEDMFKQATVAKKEAEARRESLTSLANQLMGVGFSEAETRALLDNPEQAESIIKLVEASPNKMADPTMKKRLFAPASERMAQYAGEKPMDFIKKISTPQRSGVPTVLPTEMRGAFGLRGPIDKNYLSTLGIKEEDLATELPERGVAKPLGLDMSVFADTKKAPTKAEVLGSYAKKIFEAETEEEKRQLERERDNYVDRGFPKEDKDKALTFSNTTSGLQKAISQAYTANSQKLGNSTFSIADDGTIRFAPGTAEHAQFFRNLVRRTIQNTTERFLDSEGRLPEDIAAAVNFMGDAYGIRVGRDRKIQVVEGEAETPPAKPKPKGGSKPAASPTKPTLEQFMIRARVRNPGATDAELERYYNDRYGNK